MLLPLCNLRFLALWTLGNQNTKRTRTTKLPFGHISSPSGVKPLAFPEIQTAIGLRPSKNSRQNYALSAFNPVLPTSLGQPALLKTSPLMNITPYQALAAALRERLVVIADRAAYARDPEAHLERLKAISETIVDLQQRLPAPIDPKLAHYLQRCSYDKALAHLEQ
jgi:hypothetical protein